LISVPKRFQKHAVDRNRTKRLIREVYRKHKAEYLSESNIHSLAIIYASTKVPAYSFVEEHLPKLLEKIK
jgi:ribonuclease P protein component